MSIETNQADETTPESGREYAESIGKRVLPELHDWFSPKNIFAWLIGFIERYFRSRSYRSTLIAVPFLILGIVGPGFLWWLKDAPKNNVVINYEKAAADAVRSGDDDAANVYLQSLVRLRPNDKRYRFNLALHHLEHGRIQQGLAYLQTLIDPGSQGYNPARIWLVKQAGWKEPLIPVSQQLVERQLILILDSDPMNIEANRLMADFHLRHNQLLQAENRFRKIVDRVPEFCLPLVKIQRQLKRSQEQIDFHLSNALEYYETALLAAPDNEGVRLQLAEVLAFADRRQDAVRALNEGIQRGESPKLKAALSRLYFRIAAKQLSESSVNQSSSLDLLVKALHLNPGDRNVANGLLLLAENGANVGSESFQPAITWLSENAEDEPEDVILEARLLSAAGQFDDGLTVLDNAAELTMPMKAIQAQLMLAAGRNDQSEAVVGKIIANCESRSDALDSTEILTFANVLMMDEQYEKAHRLLQNYRNNLKEAPAESTAGNVEFRNLESRELNTAFAQSCIGLFNAWCKDEAMDDEAAAIELLNDALQVNAFTVPVLHRLTDVATDSENKFGKAAGEHVSKLLASGNANAKSVIYGMLGTKALRRENFGIARKNLERAHDLNKANAVILNNLALALIREKPFSKVKAERAFGLVEDFLAASPDNANGLSTRGEILVALERWEEARTDLERSVSQQHESVASRKLLVTVLDALDEPGLAAQHRRMLEQLQSSQTTP